METIEYRLARDAECPALSEMMLQSKAHWDYDPEFIEACRNDLTITPDWLKVNHGFVAERGNVVVGFFGLGLEGHTAHVEHFFVAREAIGSGVGGLMWREYVRLAKDHGARCIEIESEPYAEAFYQRMGAVTVGSAPSTVFPGRQLPLMELKLSHSR